MHESIEGCKKAHRIRLILKPIWPIDESVTEFTTPGQRGPGNNGNNGIRYTFQIFRTGASPFRVVKEKRASERASERERERERERKRERERDREKRKKSKHQIKEEIERKREGEREREGEKRKLVIVDLVLAD